MRNRQAEQFGMFLNPRAVTFRTTGATVKLGQAIAAKGGHGTGPVKGKNMLSADYMICVWLAYGRFAGRPKNTVLAQFPFSFGRFTPYRGQGQKGFTL
jgi:hypothetical protein